MPLYSYKCQKCGDVFDSFSTIADRDTKTHCESPANRILAAPRVIPDYPGYSCPKTGKWIEGRIAHNENLKRLGCRVMESGDMESLARIRKEKQREFENSLDTSIEKTLRTLPSEKIQALGQELSSGIDATIQRT